MNITPTEEQTRGIQAIADWYKNGSSPFFYLAGYAGSGKSTIAQLAVEACGLDPSDYNQVLYAAYTGKAAMVMRRNGLHASTVHSIIYKLETHEGKDLQPVFGLWRDSPLWSAKLLVLDECSMIGQKEARDLLSFGTKILVLGDPGQLPPIKSAGYFTSQKPNFFLQEIHRQALESSIIRLAHDVRCGGEIRYGDYGDVLKLRIDDINDADMLAHDQILVGTHKTRWALNTHFLEVEGFPVDFPYMPGVKVICTRNDKEYGFYNGMIGRTSQYTDEDSIFEEERYFIQQVHVEEGITDEYDETPPIPINMGAFMDNWTTRSEKDIKYDNQVAMEPGWSSDHEIKQFLWDFAYAITIHKSQGSQWPHVLIFDDGHLRWKPEDRAKLMYTAITRASEHLTIVTP